MSGNPAQFGGRSGGKTAKAEGAMRALLDDGGLALDCRRGEIAVVSLAADGVTLVRTPIEPAEFFEVSRETSAPV